MSAQAHRPDLQILKKFIDFFGDLVRTFDTHAPDAGPSKQPDLQEPNIEVLNWLVDCRPEVFESLRSAGPQEVFEKLEANDFDDWADVQTTTQCSLEFLSSLQQVVREEEARLQAEIEAHKDEFGLLGGAAANGQLNYVKVLLELGVDVHCQNQFG